MMPSQRRLPQRSALPSVLPMVIVTVDENADAHVTVDGVEHSEGPIDRGQLGGVLASIAEAAGGPVRVEVRESNGTSYHDILTPPPRLAPRKKQHARSPAGAPLLRAHGFAAGETVLVAVLATSIRAEADGSACLLATPKRPGRFGELILLGMVSHRTVRGRRIPAARSGWSRQ